MVSAAIAPRRRLRLGQIVVDRVTFAEALDSVRELIASQRGGFVFTPNVDHVVTAAEQPALAAAYRQVTLSLADGMPVVWSSHLLGNALPEKISGSDLVEPLAELCAREGFRIYFLGAAPGVAQAAADKLVAKYSGLEVCGVEAPLVDLSDSAAIAAMIERIKAARTDLLMVALGGPKQELFIHRISRAISPTVAIGIGASLDFVAGRVRRAPKWMSRAGLEWFYRFCQEPRRLGHRYFVRDPKFLLILWRELRSAKPQRLTERP